MPPSNLPSNAMMISCHLSMDKDALAASSESTQMMVEASNKETEDKVLLGEAEVEQPTSAYVFTGQGSQEQGMGMDLYASSEVAKEVWDRADKHFMDNYGEFHH